MTEIIKCVDAKLLCKDRVVVGSLYIGQVQHASTIAFKRNFHIGCTSNLDIFDAEITV